MSQPSTASESSRRRFARHYLEMCIAMVVGMAVLGALVRAFCAVSGHEDLLEHPGTSAPIMATNMTIGMALWMLYRGHGWAATIEMSAAMYVPLAVLAPPFWLGALSGDSLLGLMHVLMLPAMLIVMLHRREEYSMSHQAHRAEAERSADAHGGFESSRAVQAQHR